MLAICSFVGLAADILPGAARMGAAAAEMHGVCPRWKRPQDYVAESLRYLSGELHRLLQVVVLVDPSAQGVVPSSVRQGELETLLNLVLQRLIDDVEMVARPAFEIGHLSERKHLACPVPVERNPLTDPGCADESPPLNFPVDRAALRCA